MTSISRRAVLVGGLGAVAAGGLALADSSGAFALGAPASTAMWTLSTVKKAVGTKVFVTVDGLRRAATVRSITAAPADKHLSAGSAYTMVLSAPELGIAGGLLTSVAGAGLPARSVFIGPCGPAAAGTYQIVVDARVPLSS